MIHLKVPYLHDREIEESAAGLLSAFAVSSKKESRPPIDIERIVEHHLNLVFEITDLKAKLAQPDVLGAAWFEEGRVAVDSSIEHEEGRLALP